MKLALCPCGNRPEKLYISPGSTFRWRYVEGDCGCGWMIEARVATMRDKNNAEEYKQCVEAWNEIPRSTSERQMEMSV